jgi:hypothetical protein
MTRRIGGKAGASGKSLPLQWLQLEEGAEKTYKAAKADPEHRLRTIPFLAGLQPNGVNPCKEGFA